MNIKSFFLSVLTIFVMLLFPQFLRADVCNPGEHIYTYEQNSDSYRVYCVKCQDEVDRNHAILYISEVDSIIKPYNENFGSKYVSSSCYNHHGVILFDGNVTSIGVKAFYQVFKKALKIDKIILPETVKIIGRQAFQSCLLTSVEFGDSITEISQSAFYGCTKLSNLNLPSSLQTIGQQAFNKCTSLTGQIVLPASLEELGVVAFGGCSKVSGIDFHSLPEIKYSSTYDYILPIQNPVFTLNLTEDSYLYFGENIIPAFSSASFSSNFVNDWNGLILPFKVASNDDYQLFKIKSLTESGNCFMMEKVDEVSANTPFLFKKKDSNVNDILFSSVDSVSISIPSSADFSNSLNIGNLSLSASYLAKTVSSDDNFFQMNGSALQRTAEGTIIPAFSAWLSDGAAGSVSSYSLIDRFGTLYYTSTDGNIVTPNSTYAGAFGTAIILNNIYENNQGCLMFDQDISIIGDSAFRSKSMLQSITIPSTVKTIGVRAFQSCKGLVSVEFPIELTSIGSAAFASCTKLTQVSLPEGIKTISNSTFSGCSKLASVSIPESVTNIGSSAFYNCTKLSSVNLPTNVSKLGSKAFYGCYTLANLSIPEKVKTINTKTFYGCTKLVANFNIIPSIDVDAFTGCDNVNFNIDDNTYIYKGNDNTIADYNTSAVYTRSMGTSNWGTAIMPFSVESNNEVQCYVLKCADGEALTFSPVDQVDANTPFVFYTENSEVQLSGTHVVSMSDENTEFSTNSVNNDGWKMSGTYVNKENLTGIYYISKNTLYRADKAVTVKKYRSWIEGSLSPSASLRIVVEQNENETAILEIAEDGSVKDATEGIYDLRGNKLDAPIKGQVNIINGKNVFIK